MAVRGFFYNATDLNDKEHMYNGQDMNEDKAPFYKEGVAYGHLQVTAAGGSMEVVVDGGTRTGYAYINLHTIHNTAPLTLTLSQASGTLPRIDRIVLRNDETERKPNGILPDGVGIPVGNLTSQLFANVYGNKLDKFVKHTLHAKYYIRYMDDFIILSADLEQLKEWRKRIEEFLEKEMELQINPKSTILYAGNGIDFCGYIHHPEYKKVRKASVRKLKKNVKQLEAGELERVEFEKKYQSRLGHMGHADTYHLTKAIEYELLFWEWEQTESGIAIPA